jgi:hypothetical protein
MQYGFIAADRWTKDGINYWVLRFEAVGSDDGDIIPISDPLPPPFQTLIESVSTPKRRFGSFEERGEERAWPDARREHSTRPSLGLTNS